MKLKILDFSGCNQQLISSLENLYPCFFKNLKNIFAQKQGLSWLVSNKGFALNLYFVNEKKITKINQEIFNKNLPTTVIALPSNRQFLDGYIFLGDIYICKEEAKKQGFSIERLFLHGFLHLLGFDHKQPEDEKNFSLIEDKLSECLS